jgi:RsiW-degrading membrane proteinase PrsW (M82 family)
MSGLVTMVAGAIPALVFMAYVDRHDAKRPEPAKLLRRAALWGGLSTLPVILAEGIVQQLSPFTGVAGALFTAFVVAGLVEESAKAVVFAAVVSRNPAFDERLDGLVYATRIGLGFALVENIGYLFNAQGEGFWGVFVMRAVLAVPGHAIFTGFTGAAAAEAKFDGKGAGLLGGLVTAVLLHGAYDAALMVMSVTVEANPASGLLVVVPFIIIVRGYRALKAKAARFLEADDRMHAHAAPVAALPFMLRP